MSKIGKHPVQLPEGVSAEVKQDEVIVKGTVTVYNGQYEYNKGCTYEKTGNTKALADMPYADGTAAWAAAKSQKDTALIPFQNALVKLYIIKFFILTYDFII